MKRYQIDKVDDFQYILTKEDHYCGQLSREIIVLNTLQITEEWALLIKQLELNLDRLFKVDIDHVQK